MVNALSSRSMAAYLAANTSGLLALSASSSAFDLITARYNQIRDYITVNEISYKDDITHLLLPPLLLRPLQLLLLWLCIGLEIVTLHQLYYFCTNQYT